MQIERRLLRNKRVSNCRNVSGRFYLIDRSKSQKPLASEKRTPKTENAENAKHRASSRNSSTRTALRKQTQQQHLMLCRSIKIKMRRNIKMFSFYFLMSLFKNLII